jgi:hypothetical protein
MSRIELGRADLALFVDPAGTRVHIPSLMAAPRRRGRAGVLVGPFEGDDYPTAFRGSGRSDSLDLTCRFGRKRQALRVALEHLVYELAPAQFDSRLLLRLHVEPALDLPLELQAFAAAGSAVAVEVFELTSTPVGYAAVDVTFTASVVEHTFAAP